MQLYEQTFVDFHNSCPAFCSHMHTNYFKQIPLEGFFLILQLGAVNDKCELSIKLQI